MSKKTKTVPIYDMWTGSYLRSTEIEVNPKVIITDDIPEDIQKILDSDDTIIEQKPSIE